MHRWVGPAWAVAALAAGFAQHRHDALVALDGEALPWMAAVAGPVLALAVVLGALAWRYPVLKWSVPLPVLAAVGFVVLAPPAPPERVGGGAGPDILLVTLDTFRADHVPLAPRFEELEVYGQAVTTAPLTGPAHASMLTGLSPLEHGLVRNGGATTQPSVVEELRAAGYATGAFLTGRVLQRETGLAHGFVHYDDRWGAHRRLFGEPEHPTRSGERAVDRALAWFEQTEGPRLLWVHLYDPHTPYLPPPDWRPSEDEKAAAARRDQQERSPSTDLKGFKQNLKAGFGEGQRLMYRAEVAWTDHLLGRLLDGAPEAKVLVVGDHGEGLGEHDEWFDHGAKLYETTMAVPLATRGLGPAHDQLVGVDQIADALRHAAGLGGSLFTPRPWVEQFTTGQSTSGPATGVVAAVRLPSAKLLSTPDGAVWFQLVEDPHEADPRPPPADAPREVLDGLLSEAPPPPDSETLRRMRALGYVE